MNKNLHVIVFKNSLPGIQLGFTIDDKTTTTINMTQGVQILRTLVLSGDKLVEALDGVKTCPEAPHEVSQCVLEHVQVEEEKAKSLEEMVAHTRYLVGEYGTENEQRYIEKFLTKVL